MSQIAGPSGGGGVLPPTVATQYDTDSGSAVPALNILNVLGNDTTANNPNGITTTGAGNTVTVLLTNRAYGTATTIGATSTAAITMPAGATPGTYTLDVKISGFTAAGVGAPLGVGYTITAAIRTTGAATVLIQNQQADQFEEGALSPGLGNVTVSANDIVVSVTGVAGYTINWVAELNYIFAS